MKHISVCSPRARASLATCAILLGAAAAFGQSGTTSSSASSTPTRDSSAGQSGTRTSSGTDNPSSAGSNYGTTDKSLNGSSSVNAGTNATTGGSAYGSTSASGQASTATGSTSASDSTRAGAPTGRETTASGKLGFMDRRFINKAADGGAAEVALAQLAAERASNSEVKSFAQQLVQDHTQVNSELMSLASQKNVKLDKDDGKDRTYKRLSNRSGTDFDQEFVEHMIDEHEKDIKMFEKASTDAKDADLRSFAAKHVDHLRHHLQMAQNLRSSIVPTGRTGNTNYESDPSTVRGGANNSNTNKSSGSDRSGTYNTPTPSSSSSSSDASPKRDTPR